MSSALAIFLGLLAVGYAVWPVWRGRDSSRLPDELTDDEAPGLIADQAAAARQWSAAAGELRDATHEPGKASSTDGKP